MMSTFVICDSIRSLTCSLWKTIISKILEKSTKSFSITEFPCRMKLTSSSTNSRLTVRRSRTGSTGKRSPMFSQTNRGDNDLKILQSSMKRANEVDAVFLEEMKEGFPTYQEIRTRRR